MINCQKILVLSLYFAVLCCHSEVETNGMTTPLTVEITGENFEWQFLYPGPDQLLYTADDIKSTQTLRLPAHTDILLILKSNDFIYTFSLPDFSAKEMAIPGLNFQLEFSTKQKGTFQLKGDQMCGFTHESLFGKVKVLSLNQFQKWLESNDPS